MVKASVQDWSTDELFDDSLDEEKDGECARGPEHLSDDSLEDDRTSTSGAMPSLISSDVTDIAFSSDSLPGSFTLPCQDACSYGPNSHLSFRDITASLSQQEARLQQQYAVDKLLDIAANFSDDSIDNDPKTLHGQDTPTVGSQQEHPLPAKHQGWDNQRPSIREVQEDQGQETEPGLISTGPGEPETTDYVHHTTSTSTVATSEVTECLAHTHSVARRSSLKKVDAGSIRNAVRKTVRFKEPEGDSSSGSDTDSLEEQSYTLHDRDFERTTVIYDPYAAEHTLLDEWEYEDDTTQL